MTRSECYRILGLSEGATETMIRRQYKKLAMRLHPDVNPDPKAHESFILLSQAVENLLSENTEVYSTKRESRRKTGKENEDEIAERMRQAKERFEFQRRQEALEEHRYFLSLTTGKKWKLFKLVSICSIVFAGLLILDTFLPNHYKSDKLVSIGTYKYSGIKYNELMQIQLKENGNYLIENRLGFWRNIYPEVRIRTTWIFHSPIEIFVSDDYTTYSAKFDSHMLSLKGFLIFFFLLPLYPLIFKRKKIEFVIIYHTTFWVNSVLLSYLLVTESRGLHVLFLGFL